MNKKYIISDNKRMLYVARVFLEDYKAQDTIQRVTRDFFGRYPCYGALVFETLEKAREYLGNMKRWYPYEGMRIHEYDTCVCNAGKVVE